MFESIGIIIEALPNLLQGAVVTLNLTMFAMFFGFIGGSLIGIARLSPRFYLNFTARVYVDFFRGTPLLVQIFMVYFGLPVIINAVGLNFTLDRLLAAIVALSLNNAAYNAEIIRAGIQSIDSGQTEAAQSLGLKPVQIMRLIVFPQAFRRMLPAFANVFISLLKDTSLVAVIGYEELFRRGQLIVANNYRSFEIYSIVALIYLVMTVIFSQGFSFLERWMVRR